MLSLDDELAIARQLQFSILPERTPQIAGLEIAAMYKPMSTVAGDLYDFLVADEQHVGFLIADVSGHSSTGATWAVEDDNYSSDPGAVGVVGFARNGGAGVLGRYIPSSGSGGVGVEGV